MLVANDQVHAQGSGPADHGIQPSDARGIEVHDVGWHHGVGDHGKTKRDANRGHAGIFHRLKVLKLVFGRLGPGSPHPVGFEPIAQVGALLKPRLP